MSSPGPQPAGRSFPAAPDTSGAPPTIVVATGNAHKVTEIAAALGAAPASPLAGFHFASIHELCPDFTDPVEDGATFEENAAIKARAAQAATGLPALADDSGLTVEALDGAPGIYSARYSGVAHDDAANNAKLLAALDQVPAEQRRARFVSCLVLTGLDALLPGCPAYLSVTGFCEGCIATGLQGENGFGYDPLFLPDAACGRSMAQLSLAEKTAISHRGAALCKLLETLQSLT